MSSSSWPGGAPASSPFNFQIQAPPSSSGTGTLNTFAPSPATAFFSTLPNVGASASPGTNPLLTQALLGGGGVGSSSTPAAGGLWGSSNMPSMANSPMIQLGGGGGGGGISTTPFGNSNNSPLASFAASQTPFLPGGPNPAGGPARSGRGGGERGNEVSIDDVMRGIDQAKLVLDQMEALLLQRQSLEQQIFSGQKEENGVMEGMEVDAPFEGTKPLQGPQAQSALLQAQSEYVQLLSAVTQLSTLSLFGGFPVPLSAASPMQSEPSKAISLAELTTWAESRAALEFSRREAVKAGSKAVLEVINAGKQQ